MTPESWPLTFTCSTHVHKREREREQRETLNCPKVTLLLSSLESEPKSWVLSQVPLPIREPQQEI